MAQYVAKPKQYHNRLAKLKNDPKQVFVAGQSYSKSKHPSVNSMTRWKGETALANQKPSLLQLFSLFFSLVFFTFFCNFFIQQKEVPHKISEQMESGCGLQSKNCDMKHVKHKRAETSGAENSIFQADFCKNNFADFLLFLKMYIFVLFRVEMRKLRPFY